MISYQSAELVRLRHDPGSSFAAQGSRERFRGCDQSLAASVLQKLHAGLNLRQHRAGLEMALTDVLLRFGDSHRVEGALARLAKVQANLFDRSG